MKSLIFALSLLLLGGVQAQAQVYVGDSYDSNTDVPPTVYYRNGKPYLPGYGESNAPRGQVNTVEVGRPYPYYGYPGYGYGYGPYNDGNTVVVGQPYYGGYGYGAYNDGNTVVVGQPYYGGYGYFGY